MIEIILYDTTQMILTIIFLSICPVIGIITIVLAIKEKDVFPLIIGSFLLGLGLWMIFLATGTLKIILI